MAISTVRNLIRNAISLEDEGGAAPIVEVNVHVSKDAAEADAAAADVEEAQDDLDNQEADVNDQQEASEEVEDTAANLESIALALEGALKEGGLGTQALTFANISINNELRRLGLEEHKVSLESMGTASGRVAQTKISLETVMESIHKAIEAVKKFFLEIARKINDFFAGFFGHVVRAKRYHDSLKKVAETQKSMKPAADAKVELPDYKFAKEDNDKKYETDPSKLASGFKANAAIILKLDAFAKAIQKIDISKLESLIDSTFDKDHVEEKIKESTIELINTGVISAEVVNAFGELMNSLEEDGIGGFVIARHIYSSLGILTKLGLRMKVGKKFTDMDANINKTLKKEKGDFPVLSGENQLLMLSSVSSLIEAMEKFKPMSRQMVDGINSTRDKIKKLIDDTMKKNDSSWFRRKESILGVMRIVSAANRAIMSINGGLFALTMDILGYVHKSQKALAKSGSSEKK